MISARREWDNPDSMMSVDDALARILDAFSPLPAIRVPLLDATGLVLAEDVTSAVNVPPFRNSAMDGYAVRSADLGVAGASLHVVKTVQAGQASDVTLETGQACRIMTGAIVPAGADSVVRFEETDEADQPAGSTRISISRAVGPGENVREAGEDVRAGAVALEAGARIRPAEIGMLSAVGETSVQVHRRPRVGVLSTGNEVVPPEDNPGPGQIRDANAAILASSVARLGGEPVMLGIARDLEDDVLQRLSGLGTLDMLVTTGGVSVGDYDMVKNVLQSAGSMHIWQVRMKPGKPLAFGHVGGVPLLGLPGNPVAALVSFDQFGRPTILRMLGRSDVSMPTVMANVLERVENRGGRRHFVRGLLTRYQGEYVFTPSGVHGSAMLSSVVASNSYLVVPEKSTVIEAGESATVQLPDEGL